MCYGNVHDQYAEYEKPLQDKKGQLDTTAAQARRENAEAQAINDTAEAENAEAEAGEVEGASTEIMKRNCVDATGETGEGHPGHLGICTASEEAGHPVHRSVLRAPCSVLRVEHVGNDMGKRRTNTSMNEEVSREGMDSTESKREEQNEGVIETGYLGEELPAHCTRSDEEAGCIVLQVSSVVNEKEKNDEEADETAAAKKTEEISKEDVEIRRLIEERRNTPKEEEQRLKEVSKRIKNA